MYIINFYIVFALLSLSNPPDKVGYADKKDSKCIFWKGHCLKKPKWLKISDIAVKSHTGRETTAGKYPSCEDNFLY